MDLLRLTGYAILMIIDSVVDVLRLSGYTILMMIDSVVDLLKALPNSMPQTLNELDQMKNIGWFEDALLPEEVQNYGILAQSIDTAICVGETYANRFQYRDLFEHKGADVINPDLGRAGGITECKRIADLADLHGVLWSPHVSTGFPPYVAASLHLAVATPNCAIMEGGNIHGSTDPFGSRGNIYLKNPIHFEPGYAYAPNGPGLGIEFDEDRLQEVIVKD